MSKWRRRAAALALSAAVAAGCERAVLDTGPVDSTDAGADRAPPSTVRDAGDARDAGGGADAIDGSPGPCPVTQPPAGRFSFLSAGNDGTCGIQTDGTVSCWGISYFSAPPAFTSTYSDVDRLTGVCAVRAASGALDCFGLPASVAATPAGAYHQVAIGENQLCARAGSAIQCWGYAGFVPPGYQFESLTGGAYSVCALEAVQHSAVCWTPGVGAETVQVQDGPFAAVDTGRFFACGLRTDGNADCWSTEYPSAPRPDAGAPMLAQAPPPGPFQEISTGEFHVCGLRPGGAVVCWGEDHDGDTVPPADLVLAHVSAGSYHTCGIQLDGTVVCWGGGASCFTARP